MLRKVLSTSFFKSFEDNLQRKYERFLTRRWPNASYQTDVMMNEKGLIELSLLIIICRNKAFEWIDKILKRKIKTEATHYTYKSSQSGIVKF